MIDEYSPLMIIENEPTDVMIFQKALEQLSYTRPIRFFDDGSEALAFAEDPGQSAPWLVFLDLNTPGMGGIEFLRFRKKSEHLMWVPVVVMSSSENPEEIRKCIINGACGFLPKSFEFNEFKESIALAIRYWSRSLTPTRNSVFNFCDE
ncbi:MAG TPA: response regulator [bacterium]|nr:response regulator [bacterium]